tara:strand:- start:252 stop:1805 length:1554 start_codon:yes stop_codon:yes gene_type:complete
MNKSCILENSSKYISKKRKSPAFDENKCCGQYRWGNDMHLYRSIMNNKGKCKWQRVKQSENTALQWTSYLSFGKLTSYGHPYNYDKSYSKGYLTEDVRDTHKYMTLIDLNIKPSIELETLDGRDDGLRGEEYIKEMKKYVSSTKLYEWFTDRLSTLHYTVVDYGIRDTSTILDMVSVYNIKDSYKDGIQINFTLDSKLPLNRSEISFAVESLTNFDDDGNYPFQIKGRNKYKTHAGVFTVVPSDYKVTSWTITEKEHQGNFYKNVKTVQIGSPNNNNIPTLPVLDAVQYIKPNGTTSSTEDPLKSYEEARFYYPNKHRSIQNTKKNKSSCTNRNPSPPCKKGFEEIITKNGSMCCYKEKYTSSKRVSPKNNKKKCPPGKILSPAGRCIKKRCPPGKKLSPKGRCVNDKKKPIQKSKQNRDEQGYMEYLDWIDKVLAMDQVKDDTGAILGYIDPEFTKEMNDKKVCFMQTSKKYNSPNRKGPPFIANLCKNMVKDGLDGNRWKSIKNKNGVYTWVRSR